MKASIIYYSKTGKTKKMAEQIAAGMNAKEIDSKAFSIEDIDHAWLLESSCIIIGSPTYYADIASKLKAFLETLGKYSVAGKLGGAFATATYSYGGGDIALQTILTHMMFFGMSVYSGGNSHGKPPIHLGPVASDSATDGDQALFYLYGERMAEMTLKLFD